MKIQTLPQAWLELLSAIQQIVKGRPIYLIGGMLRDQFLGRDCRDVDFALERDADRAGRLVADALGGKFFLLDEERGTARVLVNLDSLGRVVLDFANLRGGDLDADLASRDFSMNALAVELEHWEDIIDPLRGQKDIQAKILRSCSSTSFRDDPVRVLRAVRFANEFGFAIEKDTEKALIAVVPQLTNVSIERQRDELFLMLEGERVSQSIRQLARYGILEVLLPELIPLMGFSQSVQHEHDAWEHTLAVMDYCQEILTFILDRGVDRSRNAYLREAGEQLSIFQEPLCRYFQKQLNPFRLLRTQFLFAALYHDVGKPTSSSVDKDGRIYFIDHEGIGARMAYQRATALALSRNEVKFIRDVIKCHMLIHPIAKAKKMPSREAVYSYFLESDMAGIADCLFSLADLLATYEARMDPHRWQQGISACKMLLDGWFNHYDEWVNPALLLNGADLQVEFQLTPGPKIGYLLNRLKEAQATGVVDTIDEARKYILELLLEK